MLERVKSIVIASLENIKVGDHSEELWPHVTVVPPVEHPRLYTSEIADAVGEQLEGISPFDIEAGEVAMLDVNEGKPARKVGSKVLHIVHNRIIPVLRRKSHVEIDTSYALTDFEPHVTFDEEQEEIIALAERRNITSLFLAQRAKLKGYPKSWFVAREYKLDKG
jgi:hypothetical protein